MIAPAMIVVKLSMRFFSPPRFHRYSIDVAVKLCQLSLVEIVVRPMTPLVLLEHVVRTDQDFPDRSDSGCTGALPHFHTTMECADVRLNPIEMHDRLRQQCACR